MREDKKHCPNCHTKLEVILLSDLINEKNESGTDEMLKLIRIIFSRFTFYVCSSCGRTLIYAVPELRRVVAEATDQIIGTS